MRTNALQAVLLAALVVLAGCSALPGGSTGTSTSTGQVVVAGDDLSFDAQPMYRRLTAMHGTDLRGGMTFALSVKNSTEPGSDYFPTNFERLLGVDSEAPNATVGKHDFETALYRDVAETRCERQRWVAHELSTVVQDGFDSNTMDRFAYAVDRRLAHRGVRAGAAAYAADRYLAEHTDCGVPERSWKRLRANLSVAGALVVGRHYFGKRYVADRVNSVDEIESVYRVPAFTTEQLIHGYGVDEEPPRSLSVGTNTGGGWATNNSWGPVWIEKDAPQRLGELFVRVLLESELDYDRAAEAAAGWGNDQVVRFQRGGEVGYTWTLRWDSTGDADQFESAMRDYLAARSGGGAGEGPWPVNGSAMDVRRLADGTVVVFAGSEGFVDAASASGSGGDVTVDVGG